ncbi:MAG: portal protein [Bacteroidales bacterium]
MSGFILKSQTKQNGLLSNIQKNIRKLGFNGVEYDSRLIRQSKAVGVAEKEFEDMGILKAYTGTGYIGADTYDKNFIAYYDKEYPVRRDFLRRFALNGEIEYVVETIADESIIYDTSNYFAYPDTKNLKTVLKDEKAAEIIDCLNESYKKVYAAYNFGNSHDGWHYYKKLLVDGFLAFEIIYDTDDYNNASSIIGFKELDPISLEPEIRYTSDLKEYRVWVQYRGDSTKQRELLDSNLIYISWARGNFNTRLSYVERLVRVFNLLRTMENTRIIWNVQNAQKRVKIGIPIGGMNDVKAMARIDKFRSMYKEEVSIDSQSGEMSYNGNPNIPFSKTYIIPSKDGNQIDIGEIGTEGYDMSSTEQLKYFWNRYIIESKIPKDRFGNLNDSYAGQGNQEWNGGEDLSKEELRFAYFINRIRSIFKEILIKPTWMQFCLEYPEFKDDDALKNAIGLIYVEENLVKLSKERKLAERGATAITSLLAIKEPIVLPDGTMGEQSYFDVKFLLEKYLSLQDNDFKLNDKYKKERTDQLMKLQRAYSKITANQQGGDLGGNMGGDFGGGFGGDFGGNMGGDFGGDFGGDMGGGAPSEPTDMSGIDIDTDSVSKGLDAEFENPK